MRYLLQLRLRNPFTSSISSYKFLTNNNTRFYFHSSYRLNNMKLERTDSSKYISKTENVKKSPLDKRLFRALELNNRMKLLLISDSETDKSAASMCVGTGSLSEPTELPGLAHFLEHMLFLGSAKYPDENEYTKFVNEHGGSSNAFTSDYLTNYYFDIAPTFLSAALDRFAQFFLQPLFTESATEREANAVNSEHDKNIPVDGWRINQLIKSTCSPDHVYNHFGTGNLETLQDIPKEKKINVRNELIKFYETFYSSNIMCLAVLGKESLDELETMVVDLFENVKNKNLIPRRYDSSPFTEKELKSFVYVVPVKDIRNLKVIFPIPDVTEEYKSSPDHYISGLIGHEGPGSLHSLLRNEGWASALSTGIERLVPGTSCFTIVIELDVKGKEHIHDIIALIFQYVELLKTSGIQKWIFDELSKIEDLSFTFADKKAPASYVKNLTVDMQDYPLEDVLKVNHMLIEWKPELIKDILNYLNPDNARFFVVDKSHENIATETERWYGTKYCIRPIQPETVMKWKNVGLSEKLSLPPPNEFVPENIDLLPQDGNNGEYPCIVHESSVSRIWFKQDDEYLLPKLNVTLELLSPLAFLDPKHCVMCMMFVKLLKDSLNEYAYAASLADLTWNIVNTKYGIMISMSGFSDKLSVLLHKVFDKMSKFNIEAERFEVIKEATIRKLENFKAEQPHAHSVFYLNIVMNERAWNKVEQLAAVAAVEKDEMQDFVCNMMKTVFIQALIHGNCDKKNAMDIIKIMEEPFRIQPGLLPQQLLLNREIWLNDGCNFVYNVVTTHHNSSCVYTYYQCSLDSTENNALIELFSGIVNEPCFSVLRTQEQLGYIVSSGVRRYNGVQGFSILVQSDKHPVYVDSRIEEFLISLRKLFEDMNEDEFDRHRKSLISRKLEKPKRLAGLTGRFYTEIMSRTYNFDRANIEVSRLNTLTKNEIIDFYNKLIDTNSKLRRKIAIHVTSQLANPEMPETVSGVEEITDVIAFKTSHGLCPLPQSVISLPPIGTKSKL